jgi:V/A-type H+/Na+-transporting ATPase subunit E
MSTPDASHGVQQLIDRLREQGVEAGRTEAARIVAQARQDADRILKEAREQAARERETARAEAERLRRAGEEAVRLAGRDAILALRGALTERFVQRVEGLVRAHLQDPQVLTRLVLAVGGRAGEVVDGSDAVIHLPATATTEAELRRDPDGLARDELSQLVLAVSSEMLREGVQVRPGAHDRGLVVTLTDEGVELDLTDEAVAGLLLDHLHPRFRAMLDGVVRA